MSSEDEDMDCDVPDVPADVFVKSNVLPPGTQTKYNQAYQQFQKWNKLNGWCPISEELLMRYFADLNEKSKPSTLFANYSMLKTTFRVNDEIDISTYSKLLDYLKEKNHGYKPVKSKAFTEDEVDKFINEAPDDRWLDVKVVCIFAVSGCTSTKKLVNVKVEHVKRYDDLLLVTIPRTENTPQGTFTITGNFFCTVQRYIDLRPENPVSNRFFLSYHDGKCTAQHIGKNKFSGMPRRMATYLKLKEAERYTVLSFRKNLVAQCGSAWNQTSTVDEVVPESVELDYQTGHLKTSSFNYSRPVVPSTHQLPRKTALANYTNGNKTATTTATTDEHVCDLNCGHVKCALEEHEQSVLHAFTVMAPSDFVILDITPAVFPTDPACRWIVAYKHHLDNVTAFNADETFDDITRSIPNNVRINQRYIRGNTTHVSAAYVVVYGVNCKCQKEATDIFSFEVNEVKYEI